jgi:signal transduction histidine kinase/CheY-like chemotaxis protein
MFNFKDNLTRIVESGYLLEDNTETRQKKAALTLVPLIIGPAAFIWGSIYFYLDHPLSGSIPMSYSVISLLTLIHYFKNKKTEFLEKSQLLLVLLLPFFLMWSLGGFFHGSTVMIWALFTPIAASIFMDKKHALIWFIAYFVLLLISAVIQNFLSTNITPIPEAARIIFFVLNLGAGSAGLYLLVSYTSNQEKLAIIKINQKQRELEIKSEGLRITNAHLAEARVNADAANTAKSDFLANMSHEIRTPMHVIMGMTNLALKTELNDKQKNYLNKALYSAENLLRIINDILDFSKIEANKLELESVDFQLEDLIDNMTSMIKLKAKENDIQLSVCIDPDVPRYLNGDPLRLSQVLTNLGDNAVKFSNQGDTISFNITLLEETELDARIQFNVKDTGIGISAEQQERLFQPFNQADNSTTRKYGGTGLGLVISKNIIQMMDGETRVESEQGVGTSFTFTANLKKQQVNPSQIAALDAQNESTHDEDKTNLHGAKVLVVDDNDLNHEYIHELLDMLGITVETAFNGQKALDLLAKQDFDCVLMDCQMPVMDGYEATRQIRRQEKLKDLPVIAMTANAMKGDREKALAAGMNDYISKPFKIDDMFATLSKWIKSGKH